MSIEMPRESLKSKKDRCRQVIEILEEHYPNVYCTLIHNSPFELLSATVLAAQCTDEKVNTVTPTLFARYPNPEAMAQADLAELEEIVHPLGFFRQKARSLVELSRDIVEVYGGEVPQTLEELITLRGVGRKTANVLLGTCFTGGGIVVDTHCKRISKRLGFIKEDDPVRIEFELMKFVENNKWSIYGHLMVWHGRAICVARKPLCLDCPVFRFCPEGNSRHKQPGI